ncbi:hypothetical protein KAJ89_00055 [Candidatus Parcubacteria bacterium]|nr:hypothetical protein [Candidatus Parcubacteria bacterium]
MALTVKLKSGKLFWARARCLSCNGNVECLVGLKDEEFISTEELANYNDIKALGTVLFPVCPKLTIKKQKAA